MERTVRIYYDDAALAHDPPAGEFEAEWSGRLAVREPHPDRPARVRNIASMLRTELGEHTEWEDVQPATVPDLTRVHTPDYVSEIREWAENGGGRLTPETGGNHETYRAARYAAGAAIHAAEHALDSDGPGVSYALARPSGHHAQSAQADGFCFFNNAAVAAEHTLETGRADSVAILDWDVHHGNGTQEIFYDRDDVLFVSLHNDHESWNEATHPQTCDVTERGRGDGSGYTVNVPLPPGTGNEGYRYAMDEVVAPVVGEYDPDLLLVSTGGDPGTMDPLGRNVVTKAGFETLGTRVRELAETHADGALAFVQEGGYHPSHLAYATLGVFEGALGCTTGVEDPFAWIDGDSESATAAVNRVRDAYSDHWQVD